MARFSYIVNNFLRGEISPRTLGRTDVEGYRNACEILLNANVQAGGGAFRRRGSVFVKTLETIENEVGTTWLDVTSKNVRMIPFIFSKDEAYVFVFGINENTGVSTSQPVYVFNVNDLSQAITVDVGTGWSSPGGITDYVDVGIFGGFESVEELRQAQYAQVNDTLIITQKDRPPAVFQRTAANAFKLRSLMQMCSTTAANSSAVGFVSIAWAFGFPFRDKVIYNGLGVGMSISNAAVGTGRTLTASVASPAWSGFQPEHVGAFFRHTVGGQTGLCVVTGVTSTTVATVQVLLAFGSTSISDNWNECAWNNYRGWPRTVMAYQNRILLGGNLAEPTTVWASESGDIGQFTRESDYSAGATWTGLAAAASSDPFRTSIATGEANEIQWLMPDKNIIVGTRGREYIANIVTGTTTSSLSFSPETAFGSSYLQAKKYGPTVMFVDRSGVSTREFVFNFQEDNYRSENVSQFAEHLPYIGAALTEFSDANRNSTIPSSLTNPEIVEIQAQNAGNQQILWCKDSYGTLFSLVRDRAVGYSAWSRHILGPTPDIANLYYDQGVEIKSICVVPNQFGTYDDLWVAVSRTVNSVTDTFFEIIHGAELFNEAPWINSQYTDHHPIYTDSSVLKQDSGGFSTMDGLDHLEGETVYAVGDGEYLGSFTVSSGEIVLGATYYNVTAGLKFITLIQPVQIDAGSRAGNSQGDVKKAEEAIIRFYKSKGANIAVVKADATLELASPNNVLIGYEYNTSEFLPINFRPGDLDLDLPIPLFNGDKVVKLPGRYGINNRIAIYIEEPLPMNVLAIIFKGITYD